jgi:hypothetical protein
MIFEAIDRLAATTSAEVLTRIDGRPILAFRFGTTDRTAPALLVTGGVHGLERIGAEVAVAFLTTLAARLSWDSVLQGALERTRILVIPVVNPVGLARGTRANGNGVDLMRNAPPAPSGGTPLLGGQTVSPLLPWYMGTTMEPEARALCDFVEHETFSAPLSIAVDCHSGFGFIDRIWYPYARTREPLPDAPAVRALAQLLDDTLPNHVYRVEQTAQVYTIRGDLWDHLYDRSRTHGRGVLLPLTLEMGSWAWVRKNPLQGLTTLGRFNPVKPHRLRRTLRRHLPLLDFLFHAAASHEAWMPASA